MQQAIVLVTEQEYLKAQEVFENAVNDGWDCRPAPEDEAGLAEKIRSAGARHVIIGVARYEGALYDALPRGGVIARFGVGHDGVDKARATERGLYCVNTPGALNQAVAEHTVGLMLAAARHLTQTAAAVASGAWKPAVGVELNGKRLAVIGCGPIGCATAQIAAFGFGVRVAGCEIQEVDAERLRRDHGIERVTPDWTNAVAAADFVSLHIPSISSTRHFINAKRLSNLAPHAWLVNTARGAVVDEDALFDAIATKRLAGAALDVFEAEPYQPQSREKDLRTLSNVIMTPHLGSSTVEASTNMARQCLQNLASARDGSHRAMDLLNPEVVET